jgi:hypothetical protein
MYYVEGYTTKVNGTQELLFRVIYDEESDSMDLTRVPPKLASTWEKFGIPVSITPRVIAKPIDGMKFLEAIARDYKGSIARSDDVKVMV